MEQGELKKVEIFSFTKTLFFESVSYKGTSKISLLFEILLRLHQVQVKVELILHIVHITGTRMTEAGMDGISRGNNMGGVMRGLETFQFIPLGKGATERSDNLLPWLSYWWVGKFIPLGAMY